MKAPRPISSTIVVSKSRIQIKTKYLIAFFIFACLFAAFQCDAQNVSYPCFLGKLHLSWIYRYPKAIFCLMNKNINEFFKRIILSPIYLLELILCFFKTLILPILKWFYFSFFGPIIKIFEGIQNCIKYLAFTFPRLFLIPLKLIKYLLYPFRILISKVSPYAYEECHDTPLKCVGHQTARIFYLPIRGMDNIIITIDDWIRILEELLNKNQQEENYDNNQDNTMSQDDEAERERKRREEEEKEAERERKRKEEEEEENERKRKEQEAADRKRREEEEEAERERKRQEEEDNERKRIEEEEAENERKRKEQEDADRKRREDEENELKRKEEERKRKEEEERKRKEEERKRKEEEERKRKEEEERKRKEEEEERKRKEEEEERKRKEEEERKRKEEEERKKHRIPKEEYDDLEKRYKRVEDNVKRANKFTHEKLGCTKENCNDN